MNKDNHDYHCEYCGRRLTLSDVNDFGSLCEDCYMREYYPDEKVW